MTEFDLSRTVMQYWTATGSKRLTAKSVGVITDFSSFYCLLDNHVSGAPAEPCASDDTHNPDRN